MSVIAGRIYNQKRVRAGDPIPFERMAIALQLSDNQRFAYWQHIAQTRPSLIEKAWDLDFALKAAERVLTQLAFIESVVGYDQVNSWLANAVTRASEVRAEREQQTGRGEAS